MYETLLRGPPPRPLDAETALNSNESFSDPCGQTPRRRLTSFETMTVRSGGTSLISQSCNGLLPLKDVHQVQKKP